MRMETHAVLDAARTREIIAGARELLAKTGMKVTGTELNRELSALGAFQKKSERWLISEKQFDSFVEAYRKRPLPPPHSRFVGEASFYSCYLRDPHSGKVTETTTDSLRKAAVFSEKAAAQYPLSPVVPGYPTDVPGELSSLMRYKLALECCSQDVIPTPDALFASDYMFAMAKAAHKTMDRLPVYPISPLTLGSDSAEIVLRHKDKLKSFYVFTMPFMGITAPMHITMGYAQALAETVGSAILMEAVTGLPADIRPNLDPVDLKRFNIAFGTPLKFFLEQAGYELLSALREEPVPFSSVNIHTFAKECDCRAAMEKGMLMLSGALCGAKKFYCVGTLCLDELFDPLQLLWDLEMLQYVKRLLDGPPADRMEDTFLQEVQEGLSGGFSCSDRTLDDYKEYLELPAVCETMNWRSWVSGGEKGTLALLREKYDEIDAQPCHYQLDQAVQRELDAIYAQADAHWKEIQAEAH